MHVDMIILLGLAGTYLGKSEFNAAGRIQFKFTCHLYFSSFSDVSLLFMQPLSILCHSFRDIDTYTTGFPRGDSQGHTNIFRAVKHCLPGPVSMNVIFIATIR